MIELGLAGAAGAIAAVLADVVVYRRLDPDLPRWMRIASPLLMIASFVALFLRFGATWTTAFGAVFAFLLIPIAFIDLHLWEMPDALTLPGIAIGVVAHPVVTGGPWYDAMLGALIGPAIVLALRRVKMDSIGLGDAKMLAMIGAFLGPATALGLLVILAILIATTLPIFLFLAMFPRVGADYDHPDEAGPPLMAVPSAPAYALGALAVYLYGAT